MKPKISIVLPTYNGEKWLELSIQSVINQTIKNWELIIVNDCSTDNTLKIANSFAEKDSRITVITNETNKKLPASLNVGFSHARGEYLTWTSDDNLYKKNALEMLSSYLDNHPETSMVSMNEDIINEDGKTVKILDNSYKYKRCAAALMNNCNVGAAFMYRKSIADIVGQYDENTFCAEDYDYWCRIALAGNIDYTSDNIPEELNISEDTLEAVFSGMESVTGDASGTAYNTFKDFPIKVGGKTGSVQVSGTDADNAWFMGFAPFDEPEIAICAVVENGVHGTYTASIVLDVLREYFGLKESTDDILTDAIVNDNTMM